MGTASQRQFLASVSGVPGFFATKGGGDTTSTTTDVFNGGALTPEVLASTPVTSNITMTRPYDPARDQSIVRQLTPLVGRWRTTVAVQPTDPDLVPVGDPDVYANALLVNLVRPDLDASSAREATFQLEFAVGRTS